MKSFTPPLKLCLLLTSFTWVICICNAFLPSSPRARTPITRKIQLRHNENIVVRNPSVQWELKATNKNELSEKTLEKEELIAVIVNDPSSQESVDSCDGATPSSRRTFFQRALTGTAITAAAAATLTTTNSPALADTEILSTIPTTKKVDVSQILNKASKKAISGGKAGASAAVVQVSSLMWLRTAMNYQYRYGGNLQSSLSTLYGEGGIPRLYQGLPFALVQGPLTRFGDTAANVGVLALLDSMESTVGLPIFLKTACGSIMAGMWRIVCMPVDSSKTVMQVEGKEGLDRLWSEVLGRGEFSEGKKQGSGVGALYRGSLASAGATAVGHFPWFLTYNYLNDVVPSAEDWSIIATSSIPNAIVFGTLARSAFLGFSASCVSDCSSNSLRVIKTTKQTASLGSASDKGGEDILVEKKELTYREAVSLIVEQDGWAGLFGRGLQTRLLTNALQGAVFSILFKYFQQTS